MFEKDPSETEILKMISPIQFKYLEDLKNIFIKVIR